MVTKSKTQPKNMADLLAMSDKQIVVPQKGVVIKGVITSIDKKSLHLDIGAKTEGMVVDREFNWAENYISKLKVGDSVEAVVVSVENSKGSVLLSLKSAALDDKWEYFKKIFAEDQILTVQGLDVNKGGLIVGVNNVRGFVPSSQFGKQHLGKLNLLKGQPVRVKVIEVDKEKNRLIFSERHVSEAQQIKQREEALHKVEVGQIYTGAVSGVMPFGLFVTVEIPVGKTKKDQEDKPSVGMVEGLVHISEISWEKVNSPRDFHQVGDELKVKVLGIDENTNKLNLSIKQLSDDPWSSIEERYPTGTTFTGKVSRIEPFGVFINVEPGVDGLMHMSKITEQRTYKPDEELTVVVESIDPHNRRMSLSPVLTQVPEGYK